MKRYDGYILRFINHEGGATQQEPAEVYLASEVDAERAKDKEELRKNKVTISTQSVFLDMKDKEIARLRRALEFYGNVKNYKPDLKLLYTPLIYDDYGKIAREALEGK